MAQWKKVLVSGSSAALANIAVDSLSSGVVTGASGNLTTTAVNGTGNIVATTGASGLSHSGSFSGSFVGDGSSLTGVQADTLANSIVDGNGIADFTFDGSGGASVAVEVSGSTLTVGSAGVAVNAGGITTAELANDSVTGDKLDDAFTDGGGVAGSFGSSTNVPVITVDGQGRITTASLASISTTLSFDGNSGSDTLSLIDGTLQFRGTDGLSVAVTDDTVTVSAGGGLVSGSSQIDHDQTTNFVANEHIDHSSVSITAGDGLSGGGNITATRDIALDTGSAHFTGGVKTKLNTDNVISGSTFSSPSQGTVRATINGVNTDVDTGLQSGDSPTFAGVTITNDAVVQGDLTVQGTTTTLQTTNTAITDKFILLNSGSTNPDEGGFIIDEGGGTGHALIFDSSDLRFGINQSANATGSTYNSEAYVAAVIDENNVAHDINDTEYHKRGNIKVDAQDDVFIYV